MKPVKILLNNLISQTSSKDNLYKKNLLKEYLGVLVLNFIYSHPQYSHLIFYGGSCLAHCYGLPRLSEDLDFVDVNKEVDLKGLASDLMAYFNQADLFPSFTLQKFRIYLKFPILKEFKLAQKNESDLLFLKIEIFKGFNFPEKDYQTEMVPLFKFNQSILVKTFDLPTLMATKLNAVLYRQWEKIDKKGRTLIKVKGRDYFDFFWYLQKKVKPNLKCLKGIKDEEELREKLFKTIDRIDSRSIYLDLEALIEDNKFASNFSKNLKEILKREIGAQF